MIIRRILSIIIDFLFILLLILLSVSLSVLLRIESGIIPGALFLVLVMTGSLILATYWGNASIGKKLLGLKLIDENSSVISVSDSIVRFIFLILLISTTILIRNAIFFFFSKTFSFQIILFHCTWTFLALLYFFPIFFSKGAYTFLDIITAKKVRSESRNVTVGTRGNILAKSFLMATLITILIIMSVSNLNIVPKFRNHKSRSVSFSGLFFGEASERSLISTAFIAKQIRNMNEVFLSLSWKDFLLEEKVLRLALESDIAKINYEEQDGVYLIPIDYFSELLTKTPLLSMMSSNVRDIVRMAALSEVSQIMSDKKISSQYAIRTKYESEVKIFVFSFRIIYSELLLVDIEFKENIPFSIQPRMVVRDVKCLVPDNNIAFELGMQTPETMLQIGEL